MLLDETFSEVTERTRTLVNEQTPQCCDWDECENGPTIEEPIFGVSCGFECIFSDAYKQALSEVLVDDESGTRFLAGCCLQDDLNFYATGSQIETSSDWVKLVASMGQGFVHQRVYSAVEVRSTAEDNPARAASLVDQISARALDKLIKQPTSEGNDKLKMDEWAASWAALREVADNSYDLALIASQIGKTLPLELSDDSDFGWLHDETMLAVGPLPRIDAEGRVAPDASLHGFGGAILRAFIGEKVKSEFPGDFSAFMKERDAVVRRINDRRQRAEGPEL